MDPQQLNVVTRSTIPEEDERVVKLLGLREPRIIYLVLEVLICMSLLAVQVSREEKYVGMLLTDC